MTIREFFASGRKGGFACQLLRTYDEPWEGSFRLLQAVADGQNALLVDKAKADGFRLVLNHGQGADCAWRTSLQSCFPILAELDREMTGADYSRLPREAAICQTN